MNKCEVPSFTEDTNNSEQKCRWKLHNIYRLLICAWMISDTVTVTSVAEISHEGFYIRAVIHVVGVIFMGIPIVYSELSIAQYTNCNTLTLWNFFPLFRGVGYGMIYISIMKCIYLIIVTTWYLNYTFYSAFDPPPWFSCDGFSNMCMVKRINITIFQHCLEMLKLLNEDCGMKTASNYFFTSIIGNNTTINAWPHCMYGWKQVLSSAVICFVLFLLSLKAQKWIQIAIKFVTIYVIIGMFLLSCISLSTGGAWNIGNINIDWNICQWKSCLDAVGDAVLSMGTGQGMLVFLSSDLRFRSPATMTAILTPLSSMLTTIILSFIAFNGITAMSYYHGEEKYIIEIDENAYFTSFASMTEILSYFNGVSFWTFVWFSLICLCLFMNIWLLSMYVNGLAILCINSVKYKNLVSFSLSVIFFLLTLPFYCSDIAIGLIEALKISELVCTFLFSLSLYWIYGVKKHSVDLLFMLGIKASIFWKMAWFFSPPLLLTLIVIRLITIENHLDNTISYNIRFLDIEVTHLVFCGIILVFLLIIIIGTLWEIFKYRPFKNIKNIVYPTPHWGPRDYILFRSRKMFVPEIMTREFLYRQVRIRGLCTKHVNKEEEATRPQSVDSLSTDNLKWSTLTSN